MKRLELLVFGAAVWCLATAPGTPAFSTENAKYAPQEGALFAAFKAFCVDTGANPAAVNAAIEAAGGKPHNPPGGSATPTGFPGDPPFPLTLSIWDIAFQGHQMVVDTGTGYPSQVIKTAKRAKLDFDSCTITSYGNEEKSVAAIRDWVGVPPQTVSASPNNDKWSPSLTRYHYGYQVVGAARVAVTDQAQLLSAEREGRYWMLVLLADSHMASVILTHTLPASNSPQP